MRDFVFKKTKGGEDEGHVIASSSTETGMEQEGRKSMSITQEVLFEKNKDGVEKIHEIKRVSSPEEESKEKKGWGRSSVLSVRQSLRPKLHYERAEKETGGDI